MKRDMWVSIGIVWVPIIIASIMGLYFADAYERQSQDEWIQLQVRDIRRMCQQLRSDGMPDAQALTLETGLVELRQNIARVNPPKRGWMTVLVLVLIGSSFSQIFAVARSLEKRIQRIEQNKAGPSPNA